MPTLHPEERIRVGKYRPALVEQRPGVIARLFVYGSKVREAAHEESDIDVLLVVKNEVGGASVRSGTSGTTLRQLRMPCLRS